MKNSRRYTSSFTPPQQSGLPGFFSFLPPSPPFFLTSYPLLFPVFGLHPPALICHSDQRAHSRFLRQKNLRAPVWCHGPNTYGKREGTGSLGSSKIGGTAKSPKEQRNIEQGVHTTVVFFVGMVRSCPLPCLFIFLSLHYFLRFLFFPLCGCR